MNYHSLHSFSYSTPNSISIHQAERDEEEEVSPVSIGFWQNNSSNKQNHKFFKEDESKLSRLWKRKYQWGQIATLKKGNLDWWRHVNLILVVLGASMSTLATQLENEKGWVAAFTGSVCLASVPFISIMFLNPQKINESTRLRATAGFMESEFYLFRNKVHPYNNDDDVINVASLTDRFTTLRESLQDTKHLFVLEGREASTNQSILPLDLTLLGPNKIEDRIGVAKKRGFQYNSMSKRKYIEERLAAKHKKFKDDAKELAFIGSVASFWLYLFGCLAALAGFLSGIMDGVESFSIPSRLGPFVPKNPGIWASVLTTAAATMSIYLADRKHFELSALYMGTAQRLEDLWMCVDELNTIEKWKQFVLDCERIILAEHMKWKEIKSARKRDDDNIEIFPLLNIIIRRRSLETLGSTDTTEHTIEIEESTNASKETTQLIGTKEKQSVEEYDSAPV